MEAVAKRDLEPLLAAVSKDMAAYEEQMAGIEASVAVSEKEDALSTLAYLRNLRYM